MVAKLRTLDDCLSCLDHLSPSKQSRLDQIISGLRPQANEYADDPIGYCREHLGVTLWDKQREIIEKFMTPPYQVLVRAGHNVGKTFVAACLASWFYDSFNPSQTLCTAPSKASVRDVLFAELRRLRPNQEGFLPKDTLLEDKSPTGANLQLPSLSSHHHCVRGLTTAKSEAFQGRHAERLLLIYDEAVGIDPQYFEVGRSLFTGSPGQGWICFYNPTNPGSQVYREEASGQWHTVTMSQFDHPNIAAELAGQDPPYPSAVRLSQLRRDMDNYGARIDPAKPPQDGEVSLSAQLRWLPGPLADCRILGRWPRGLGNNVWSDGLWERMEKVHMELNPDWLVQIGCDVAAYGFDETAIVVKHGPCVLSAERHSGWGPQQTMTYLKELCHRFCGRRPPQSVACLIDAAGIGLGVADYANGYNFVPILSAQKASDAESYNNLRSELWFRAQKFAQVDLIDISRIPEEERRRLKVELLTPTYDLDPMNRLRVEPKVITKKKLRRSPDLADAFNLACYWLYPGTG